MRKYRKPMHCSPDINMHKWYCSTKTKYPTLHPEQCEFIGSYELMYNYIKVHINEYDYQLPFLIAKEIRLRLAEEGIEEE